MPRTTASFDGDFKDAAETLARDIAGAVTAAVRRATDLAKAGGRKSIRSSLRGRAPNLLGAATFPRGDVSVNAAGSIFARGKLADRILSAHEQGATIVPQGGKKYLALPTDYVPKGPRGSRLKPADVERTFGRKLQYIPRKGGGGYLVLPPVTVRGRRRSGERPLLMFVLVRQITLPKRTDVAGAVEVALDALPALLDAELSKV